MELEDGFGPDDEPRSPLLPPDDRLWRHPSEVAAHGSPEGARHRPPPPGRGRVWPVGGLAGAMVAVLGVALLAGVGGAGDTGTGPDRVFAVSTTSFHSPAPATATEAMRLVAVKLRPALVTLEVERAAGGGHGSGVVFRADGHVLTANQVVAGATRITAVTADGRRQVAAVVGWDDDTDIAVVRLARPASHHEPLPAAPALAVGQPVIAVGAAAPAALPWTSVGTVRHLGRRVDRGSGEALLDMIETDTPIAPPAVGGALVDASGAVVGITTRAADGDAGLATPMGFARHVAERLLATGRMPHVWLGVEGDDLDGGAGVVVTEVRSGSPAQRAGLARGDVITAVDAAPVPSMAALRTVLRWRDPGANVVVALRRGPHHRSVPVVLSERPDGP